MERNYWFPAKRYGWGWGLPIRWQGWICLAIYLASVSMTIHFFRPTRQPGMFTLGLVLLTFGFVTVCWLKGEPLGEHHDQ